MWKLTASVASSIFPVFQKKGKILLSSDAVMHLSLHCPVSLQKTVLFWSQCHTIGFRESFCWLWGREVEAAFQVPLNSPLVTPVTAPSCSQVCSVDTSGSNTGHMTFTPGLCLHLDLLLFMSTSSRLQDVKKNLVPLSCAPRCTFLSVCFEFCI